MEGKLYINGQSVELWHMENSELDGDDVLSITLPDHILVDKKNVEKWIGDIDEEDAEALGSILRIDGDKYINKKVRILIQSLGPKAKNGR